MRKTCEQYINDNNETGFRNCSRYATHVVILNGRAFEYLCTQHANLVRIRGNWGPDAQLIEMQGTK